MLGDFVAFPLVFGSRRYVWLGVLTHYVLDVAGTTRGIALVYPFPREYTSRSGFPSRRAFALAVTLCITVVALALVVRLMRLPASIDGRTLLLSFCLALTVSAPPVISY